ncbi:MAG: hypothetical protein MJK04_35960, partial [Psychrosphaera sp.]|nr:hypothetical protein [Psychrosphaera sp.]
GLCTLVLGWLSSVGALNWINLKIHDQALGLPFSGAAESSMLLIHNDLTDEAQLSIQLNQLVQQLSEHQAKNIVLMTRFERIAGLLVGLPLSVHLAMPAGAKPHRLRKSKNPLIQVELFDLYATDGIYREFGGGDELLKLFGNINVNTKESTKASPEENRQKRYLNYFLDIATLPNLTLSQALGGSIVDELVAEKVVLIDLDYHQNQTPLFIPRSAISPAQASNTATHGQLQALAAHTLLTDSDIRHLPIAITLALLLVAYTSYFFILQLLSPKGTFVFGVVLSVLTYWLAMLILVNWHVLLAVFELIIIQVFAVVYLLGIERLRKESSLLKMSAELNARLSKKVQPPSFYQSE